MLVLGRKENEQVRIIVGPEAKALFDKEGRIVIDMTIVMLRGNTCRVGFNAPKEVRVLRGEVTEREDHSVTPPPAAE